MAREAADDPVAGRPTPPVSLDERLSEPWPDEASHDADGSDRDSDAGEAARPGGVGRWWAARRERARRHRAAAPRWRERLIPRSVLGMSMLILAFAVGAAGSGVSLYAYYQHRLDQNEQRVNAFVTGFDKRYDTASKSIDAQSANARSEIQRELDPLKKYRAEGETLLAVLNRVGPSVWFAQTQDEAGQPSVGSAFAVLSDKGQTVFVTSWTTVRAAARQPGPDIVLRKGDEQVKATLWTWQEERDLALLVVPRGSVPVVAFAPKGAAVHIGDRLFALAGLGGSGASISQGFVADVSATTIQHDAAVGPAFQGGPLLNSDGQVLGVASRTYAPLGYASDAVWFGVPSQSLCEKVLRCPDGLPGQAQAGDRRP